MWYNSCSPCVYPIISKRTLRWCGKHTYVRRDGWVFSLPVCHLASSCVLLR